MSHTLETERLLLRQFVLEDAPAVLLMQSDPDVMRYTGETAMTTLNEVRAMLEERPIADYQRYGFGRWACLLKATGELIGGVGLKYLPELDEVDIGYRLRRDCWGRGLATEAARACIEYGFDSLRLLRIIGLVEPENVASVRVLEKCGFVLERNVQYRGSMLPQYTVKPVA